MARRPVWSFRAPTGSVMTVGSGAPREPGEFEVSDDGQNDGTSDDLALRPVPDAGVLAPDGSSSSLRNAEAHMNTDEARARRSVRRRWWTFRAPCRRRDESRCVLPDSPAADA